MMKNSPQYNHPSVVSRRDFLGKTAAGMIGISALSAGRSNGIEDKLKIGLIGCGWYGMVDLKAAFAVGGVECLALCDVDSEHLKTSADEVEQLQGYRPQTFKHHKELLEVSGLQAVIIATPPHWHALHFLDAIDAGMDIYCEKPLAYDIREGQAMVAAANKSKQIVQIGFQRRQSQTIKEARQFIQSGLLGKVIQVDVQIHYTAKMLDATPQNPPASLDWDLWCGPAPMLPYSPQIGHKSWRLEKEYGNGHLVDWGIHNIDATRWILGEKMPNAVTAAGGIYHFTKNITTPDVMTAFFDFETCPVIWRHRLWGATEYTSEVSNGIFFYMERGTVFVSDRRWIIIPKEEGKERQDKSLRTAMGEEHMRNFLNAVRSREQPDCLIDDAAISTATVQLGMIAWQVKQQVGWDHQAGTVKDNPKAEALLRREYRSPYKHPYHV